MFWAEKFLFLAASSMHFSACRMQDINIKVCGIRRGGQGGTGEDKGCSCEALGRNGRDVVRWIVGGFDEGKNKIWASLFRFVLVTYLHLCLQISWQVTYCLTSEAPISARGFMHLENVHVAVPKSGSFFWSTLCSFSYYSCALVHQSSWDIAKVRGTKLALPCTSLSA
jgi:hypothetical protein